MPSPAPVILPDGTCRIPLDQDYVVEPPVWGDAPRSRNWLAILDEDPQQPGGVRRQWLPRGRGRFRYSTAKLLPDDLIEFGADYVSCSGHRYRERWYAVVVRSEEFALVVRHFPKLQDLLTDAYHRRTQQAAS
jgi:hypothetical protein